MPVPVDDPGDPRLVDYVALTDVARRRRIEPEHEGGIFIAEGEQVVRRALAAGYPLRSLLLDPKRMPSLSDVVAATDRPTYVAGQAVLAAVTGFHVHRGVLASFGRKPPVGLATVLESARRLLVCADLVSTTNLGAVLRSAAAFGMDAVLLSPGCCDPLYRRAVRVSMGESLRLPTVRLTRWPEQLADMRAAGFALLALTPDPDAVAIDSITFGDRVALLLGEEGAGLAAAVLDAADHRVRIPIAAGVDSLNVAAAAAIACYLAGEVAAR